jgi:hypothetical protein
MVAGGILMLLALFLFRPAANQLRSRIVSTISVALGRPVQVAYVRVHILPRPGFDLKNFVVEDDSAFGTEPMLRASEVTAALRLRSLLRGRLEISRLSLTEPSLNLVRNTDGHWNIETLIERSSQIQAAPTGKMQTEKRRMFPYIEASRGRINMKFGAEKKPYALTDADFALWQDSDNSWGTRLRAQPVRTDLNLTDTGLIQVNGTWQRAQMLRNTPLEFTLTWERGQLGQLTKLFYGSDMGWRGALQAQVALSGTPGDLAISTDFSADDFHRYDVLGNSGLRLVAECSGRYSTVKKLFSQIACHAPGPDGAITIAGSIGNGFENRDYHVNVAIEGMPVQSLMNVAHHLTRALPDDLVASGQIDANLRFQRDLARGGLAEWSGGGEVSDLHLASRHVSGEVELGSVPFVLVSKQPTLRPRSRALSGAEFALGPHLEIGPFHADFGRPSLALIQGHVAGSGYGFEINGEGQIARLLQAARVVGLTALAPQAEGSAKVDLQIAGTWSGSGVPRATGKAQLHSLRAQLRHWNGPLEVASADLNLLPEEIDVRNVNASVANGAWHGSLEIPRPCGFTGECAIRFDLHADEISLDSANQLLNPSIPAQPWYRFFSTEQTSGALFLLTANATGKLVANRVVFRHFEATQFSAQAELKAGRLHLTEIRAEVLGGEHSGDWQADFTAKPPQYGGSGMIEGVSLHQLATAMADGWVTGSADATYVIKAAGVTQGELYSSASGTLKVRAWDGSLPHIVLNDGDPALQFHRLTVSLQLDKEAFKITDSRLNSLDGVYQLSGTASLGRALDLRLTREGAPGFAITGTLEEPRVSEVSSSETQAALKASAR